MSSTFVDWPTQREGWAASLVQHLFPGMRTQNPKAYAHDVQFIYDWETSVDARTRNDPLNLRKHGDFKGPFYAMVGSMQFLHMKDQSAILAAMQKGDYDAAKHALSVHHVTVSGKGKLPSKIDTKSGNYGANDVPSIWSELGGTLTGMPGQAAKDAGGIGGFLTGHMVLIVLIIVAVVVLGKK